MRILILSQWFDPEPTFKGLAFARELVWLGHQVEVLTGFPNYPGGKVYPGYAVKFLQRETIDGISVIRVPLYPSHDASVFGRILNYLSFAVAAAVLGPLLIKKADVAYVYHPPATVALPALILKLTRGIPFVYDIQDLWPDTLAATGMAKGRFLSACVGLWCRFVYRFADHITVLSPGFKRALEARGVPGAKMTTIYNWSDEAQLTGPASLPDDDTLKRLAGRFNVVFAGNMGKAQALDSIVSAAAIVARNHPGVQFVFVGGGIEAERLILKVKDEGIQNVVFLPRLPMNRIGAVLAAADLLLVHLKRDPLFSVTIPSKLQAYMAAGRPILLGVQGDAETLLLNAGAGAVCEAENPESIAAEVIKFIELPAEQREAMGKSGRLYYEKELSLGRGTRHFERVFASVAGQL